MALLFTAGIHASLTTAANPVIILIGGDSWACNIQRIHRFIRGAPRFSLVIRFGVGRMLRFGLEEKYLVQCGSIWWGRYDSKAIERFLDHSNASEDNIGIAQLVGYWRSLQKWKDNHTRQGGCSGRNLPAGPSNRPPGDEDKDDLPENGLSQDGI
jgi:hypothetical protein